MFKDLIKTEEYNFLREGVLKNNLCLLTLGGSYAYGTNISTSEHKSDIDIRGIYTHSSREILTMTGEDKPFLDNNTDTTIYPLKQIIKLLHNNNPNTLEILGTAEEHTLYCNKYGKMIRDNSDLFLSKKSYYSFGSYAMQQLKRLQNALCHDSYPQTEKEQHMLKVIDTKIIKMNTRYQKFDDNSINLYIDKSNKEKFDTEIFMDINLSKYPLRDFKGIYSEMSQIVRDYDKLNHRNNKKDGDHLLKHAMHLIRLLITGCEVLQGKGINTYRENDRQYLLDIRNGKYSFEEIFDEANKLEKELNYSFKNSLLPDRPDDKKINDLVMEINLDIIKKGMA